MLQWMDVALIQWPSDEELRQELAGIRHPRLLLVDANAEPPECADVLEDWVRLPVSRADRNARIRSLETRVGAKAPAVPRLEDNGTLEFCGSRAHLSSVQVGLTRPMIERFGAVVSRDELGAAAWPHSAPTGNNLDVAMGRLRRRLGPLGLRVRTIRSRGYLLTVAE